MEVDGVGKRSIMNILIYGKVQEYREIKTFAAEKNTESIRKIIFPSFKFISGMMIWNPSRKRDTEVSGFDIDLCIKQQKFF
jgi:hypothetical protein